MFRTLCVHHQEDHLYIQFFMICFSYVYVGSVAGGCIEHIHLLDCLQKCMKTYHKRLYVQIVFLVMKT
jgi:hypothetical protein